MFDVNLSWSENKIQNLKWSVWEAKGGEQGGGRKEAESEILIGKKREMVCPGIIFIRKAVNKSSSVEFLFLEFVKSNFENFGLRERRDFAIGNFI